MGILGRVAKNVVVSQTTRAINRGIAAGQTKAAVNSTPGSPPAQQSLSWAGHCAVCGTNVWLNDDGSCPAGHGRENVSAQYQAVRS